MTDTKSPKEHIEHLRLRNRAYGVERRKNLVKRILENGTYFPREVGYKDIDKAFRDFVDHDLPISYDGKKVPTVSLFSSQKIGEYSQTWQYIDDTGNILMNFKTVTRDPNPQKGTIYMGMFNIPGERRYTMFRVPVLNENGGVSYDIYSMKQPYAVDFVYTVNLVTNKYELLNEFNELVQDKFKALQCYIFPNEHPMSMILSNVSDESEYAIDDRKFYSQSFQMTLRGYIIRKEDFQVEQLPSRVVLYSEGDRYSRKPGKPNVEAEEITDPCKVEQIDDRYYYKTVQANIYFNGCEKEREFVTDFSLTLTTFQTKNIYDFRFFINGELTDITEAEGVEILEGDTVRILIEKERINRDSTMSIIGYDKNVKLDKEYKPESSLDEIPDSEEIDLE